MRMFKVLSLISVLGSSAGFSAEMVSLTAEAQSDLLGVLHYNDGGFQTLDFDLTNAELLKSFQIAVPTFCRDIEVLEAGVVSQGISSTGDLNRGMVSINNGAGLIAKSIWVSLNAPSGTNCDIPVYRKGRTTNPPSPNDLVVNGDYRGRIGNDVYDLSIESDEIISSTFAITSHATNTTVPVFFDRRARETSRGEFKFAGKFSNYYFNPFGQRVRCTFSAELLLIERSQGRYLVDFTFPATIEVDGLNRCFATSTQRQSGSISRQ